MTKVFQNFGLFFNIVKYVHVLVSAKMDWATYILNVFFTNSSGHPESTSVAAHLKPSLHEHQKMDPFFSKNVRTLRNFPICFVPDISVFIARVNQPLIQALL
jgi:hypothetical protein